MGSRIELKPTSSTPPIKSSKNAWGRGRAGAAGALGAAAAGARGMVVWRGLQRARAGARARASPPAAPARAAGRGQRRVQAACGSQREPEPPAVPGAGAVLRRRGEREHQRVGAGPALHGEHRRAAGVGRLVCAVGVGARRGGAQAGPDSRGAAHHPAGRQPVRAERRRRRRGKALGQEPRCRGGAGIALAQ